MNYGQWFVTLYRDQDQLQEKKSRKTKWLSEEDLQVAMKRKEAKSKGVKEMYPFECKVPKNSEER